MVPRYDTILFAYLEKDLIQLNNNDIQKVLYILKNALILKIIKLHINNYLVILEYSSVVGGF